ncbi:pentapeptide repeat-containing protein [Thermocoleostomius sinensis]|uniref:Pentapeptide repeat-containing protein n=1 Tax=Thermocoleostomius sinensis A174 TaxID=2016057 RepID=A0A9E8ZEZ9_9CYAN|nr:pentapeptide repeat-containing protein [Thermocoleostomius sinensis]WAL60597.1 pentapeptide repeat-containing protein [Thermocoleostomius sinensis A174]
MKEQVVELKRMKVEQLLTQYQQGERNFRGLDLRGKSFRGKDLSDADFSKADIRGTDFTNAILRNTTFAKAKAGLQPHAAVIMSLVFIAAAALLGASAGLVDRVVEFRFHSSHLVDLIPKWLTLGVLIGFAAIAIRNGLAASFSVFILAFIFSGMVALASSAAVISAGAIAIAITVASFVAAVTTFLVLATAVTTLAWNAWAALAVLIAFGIPFLLIAVPTAGESAIGLAIIVIAMSAIITWRALNGDRRHAQIMAVAFNVVTKWGTSFWGADLTRADFTDAILRNTNFNEAILTAVRWENGVMTEAGGSPSLILNQ